MMQVGGLVPLVGAHVAPHAPHARAHARCTRHTGVTDALGSPHTFSSSYCCAHAHAPFTAHHALWLHTPTLNPFYPTFPHTGWPTPHYPSHCLPTYHRTAATPHRAWRRFRTLAPHTCPTLRPLRVPTHAGMGPWTCRTVAPYIPPSHPATRSCSSRRTLPTFRPTFVLPLPFPRSSTTYTAFPTTARCGSFCQPSRSGILPLSNSTLYHLMDDVNAQLPIRGLDCPLPTRLNDGRRSPPAL